MTLGCLFELSGHVYFWKLKVENNCSKPDSVVQQILTMSLELDFGITVFLYVFESVSNFLSLTISLILCCPLSLNRSPDLLHCSSPLIFHFPFPDQGRLIPVSPCPGPRDPGRRAAGRSRRWREAAGRGRVNQCFPIRADMHFTPRDSPQPAN